MKKLFTFLMLAALVAMGFAQQKMLPIEQGHFFGNVTEPIRSDWYGSMDWESGFRLTSANDAYYLVIDAGEIAPAAILEKVYFIHAYLPTAAGPNAPANTNVSYTINLYRNPTVADNVLTPGELISSQEYIGSSDQNESGPVIVPLNNPYTVVAGESLCVGIVMEGPSYIGLSAPDSVMQSHNFARLAAGDPNEITSYVFGDEGAYDPMPFVLAVFYNDGEAYVNTTDWWAQIYSLETADSQESIDYLYVDDFMMDDSLYLAPALWNMGPDSNLADGRMFLYIETAEHVIVDTLIDENLSVVVANSANGINLAAMQGYTFKSFGGFMAFSDMEVMGLTFPFNVCLSYETFGSDPNLANNMACVEITDIDLGVSETANTLSISPNPASTYIKVENAAGSQITVYNLAGQEVLSVASAEANETLNVSNLNAGLYIVRVVNGNEVSTAKVSIVR